MPTRDTTVAIPPRCGTMKRCMRDFLGYNIFRTRSGRRSRRLPVHSAAKVRVYGRLGWTGRIDHRSGPRQGRAHALALAAAGADIVAADAPRSMVGLTYPLGTEDDLRDTARRVGELGTRCLPIALDVRDSTAVGAAVEQTLNGMGSLDIVVANAGIVSTGPLDEVSDEIWQQLVDTNLTGVFHTLRA